MYRPKHQTIRHPDNVAAELYRESFGLRWFADRLEIPASHHVPKHAARGDKTDMGRLAFSSIRSPWIGRFTR